VVYETAVEANRAWNVDADLPYEHVILDSWSLDVSKAVVGSGMKVVSDHYLHVPRHPLRPLVAFAPDAVVAAGGGMWASPANNIALAARRRHGWAWVPRWESFPRPRPTLPRRVAEPWVRRFMRAGDAWIAIGTRSASDLARLGADPRRIQLAPVVAPAPESPVGAIRPHDAPRFLFVGQLIPRKGIEVLLEAWRDVDGELTVAGDGVLRPAVEAAAVADPRIRYAGHADAEALEGLYDWADVLVLPSLYEVWGVVVNEALERGLVVVATDEVGAVDDLIVDGVNGLVVRAGSSDDLRRALRAVGDWPGERWQRANEVSRGLLDGRLDRAVEGYVQACALGVAHRRSLVGRRR
jgi:glycosyltransferase involved in cell wall biosynthesis